MILILASIVLGLIAIFMGAVIFLKAVIPFVYANGEVDLVGCFLTVFVSLFSGALAILGCIGIAMGVYNGLSLIF